MLLLDGLDKLNSNDRPQVVKRIKDFLDTDGEKCRVIITCRTQVYNQEFNQEADQVLDVVEFSDQQIRRFLGAWKSEIPADKSIEQLIQTLRERPRIMALARNPLLLTIIAYLYTDTTFILPHSRSEFYQQATDILLEKWDQSKPQSLPNQYRGRDKRQVLQVLALYNQDSTNQESQDRRSMDYWVALEQVKSVLPLLNLPVENAEAILNEIVERSGLLLAIDGGQRYQFSHLTLQEFCAAAALSQRSEELVIRFEKDKDAWREVVKLWCGLADQSTKLIRAIYAIEPITAFECLADANNVDPNLADEIIEYFKGQLGNGKNEDDITSAFGAVAASNRQGSRGITVFNYLKDTLLNAQQYSKSLASIATALAKTNLPKAADIIAQHYQDMSDHNHPLAISLRSEQLP
ncbi:MAG: NACHT domain-containing protein, partial [Snowella sp.]